MEWSKRILLQRELDNANNGELYKRMAKLIEDEPDKAERDMLLDLIRENLGGNAAAEVSGILRRKK